MCWVTDGLLMLFVLVYTELMPEAARVPPVPPSPEHGRARCDPIRRLRWLLYLYDVIGIQGICWISFSLTGLHGALVLI
jgi:hypothetical protein